jgi:hypothetical protein
MKKRIFFGLIMLGLAAAAYAAGAAFEKADTNRDGKIDKKEFDGAVTSKFKQYDRNRDGVLDMSEIRDVQRKNRGADVIREFKDMDTNGDGVVDLKEFKDAASRRFREYDRNGDRVLDRPELDYRQSYEPPGSTGRPFEGFYF